MRLEGQKPCASEMQHSALNRNIEIPYKNRATCPWFYGLQQHDLRTLPSIEHKILPCSLLKDLKTLDILTRYHSRTQIWGSTLSDDWVF